MEKLTYAMENYLEAIYELSGAEKGARVTDIANKMGVTKASTSSAMSVLSEKGLIISKKYQEVFLTPKGLKIAQQTSKKHQLILHFFTEVLNIDFDIADADACAIEHVISKESIQAMEQFLINYNEKAGHKK
ncbi:metal-dependent transcriptional regulator [Alkaliphilus crotonatoxidans]